MHAVITLLGLFYFIHIMRSESGLVRVLLDSQTVPVPVVRV